MSNQKTPSAAPSIIKSILWSVGATFAILGMIEVFAYSGNGISYFIVSIVFGVLWAAFSVVTKKPKRDEWRQEEH